MLIPTKSFLKPFSKTSNINKFIVELPLVFKDYGNERPVMKYGSKILCTVDDYSINS